MGDTGGNSGTPRRWKGKEETSCELQDGCSRAQVCGMSCGSLCPSRAVPGSRMVDTTRVQRSTSCNTSTHGVAQSRDSQTLENQRQMWGFCPPKEPEGSCSTSILMPPSCNSSLWELRQRSNVAHSVVFFNVNTERLVGVWFKKKKSLYKKSANVNKQSLYTFNLKI